MTVIPAILGTINVQISTDDMRSLTKKDENISKCLFCGKKASEGSIKHPYCWKCFKKEFNNDYIKSQIQDHSKLKELKK